MTKTCPTQERCDKEMSREELRVLVHHRNASIPILTALVIPRHLELAIFIPGLSNFHEGLPQIKHPSNKAAELAHAEPKEPEPKPEVNLPTFS